MQGQQALGFACLGSKGKHLGSCWQLICACVLAGSATVGRNNGGDEGKQVKGHVNMRCMWLSNRVLGLGDEQLTKFFKTGALYLYLCSMCICVMCVCCIYVCAQMCITGFLATEAWYVSVSPGCVVRETKALRWVWGTFPRSPSRCPTLYGNSTP